MAEYRLYVMDEANHILTFRVAECESDAEAVIAATKEPLMAHRWIEIWQGGRMVDEWHPPQQHRTETHHLGV